MTEDKSYLKGKSILVVDDEEDILETIEDILDDSTIHTARTYESASEKIAKHSYDLAILDIMGVNGLQLLDECVAKGMPTVMLTAHAVNPDTLMASIRKGAISYLPKESLADLDVDLVAQGIENGHRAPVHSHGLGKNVEHLVKRLSQLEVLVQGVADVIQKGYFFDSFHGPDSPRRLNCDVEA